MGVEFCLLGFGVRFGIEYYTYVALKHTYNMEGIGGVES